MYRNAFVRRARRHDDKEISVSDLVNEFGTLFLELLDFGVQPDGAS